MGTLSSMFVTFEGPEGAGKSTALRSVASSLEDQGHQVFMTREPGAGDFGRKIRQLLLEEGDVVPESELLLFLADRANHVQTMIRPALAEGKIVLCDRYADSTMVYQGYTRGLDIAFLQAAIKFATKGLLPDRTLLFDLPAEVGLQRLAPTASSSRDNNRLDREPLEFHQKVRQGFLNLAAQHPERFWMIDAQNTPETVAQDALQAVQSLMNPPSVPT